MRPALIALFLTAITAQAAEENSILFPRQLQPKLTKREQCQLGNEWKRYGSMRECIEEKRHEELVDLEKRRMQQVEDREAAASGERRRLSDQLRSHEEWETNRELLEQTERLLSH